MLLLPRIARDYSELKVYHVILRGVNKQDIFLSKSDYSKFLEIIGQTKEKFEYEIYAYCLMNNHIHIVIYDKNNNLSRIMQCVEGSYANFFNKKYERVGHLFQNRFLSKKIENREYLKMVCRYIHKNPLKAGIARTDEYKWSSYKEYIKYNKLIDTRFLLSIFSENIEEAKEEFIKFHNIESNKEIYDFMEYEMQEKITDEQLIKYICDLINVENVYEILKLDTKERNRVLMIIKENKNIKSIQIARVLGINRKIVERAR